MVKMLRALFLVIALATGSVHAEDVQEVNPAPSLGKAIGFLIGSLAGGVASFVSDIQSGTREAAAKLTNSTSHPGDVDAVEETKPGPFSILSALVPTQDPAPVETRVPRLIAHTDQ